MGKLEQTTVLKRVYASCWISHKGNGQSMTSSIEHHVQCCLIRLARSFLTYYGNNFASVSYSVG
jgi:hypothetical protein